MTVTAVLTNPVSGGLGAYPMDYSIFGGVDFSDQITPIAPAIPAFVDDTDTPDALSVEVGSYKVVFLAFPFEAMGTAGDRANLMQHVLSYFGVPHPLYLPLLTKNGP